MSISGAIRKSGGTQGAALSLSSTRGWSDGWLNADNVSLSTEKAMKVSTVSRCVDLRSDIIAMLPVYIMDEASKKRLPGHRLRNVLCERANEAMSRFDYEKLMQVNLDLTGNAYAWIVRDPHFAGVVELIPLLTSHVTPYVDQSGALWYVYTNPRTGEMTRLWPEDVLHYKSYSKDGINGISVLSRAAMAISTGYDAQRYQRALYQNGGRPSGVLEAGTDLGGMTTVKKADGTTEEISQREYIRREWDRVQSGPGNGFRTAVLDHGLKYTPISMSNSDAQFVESEEYRVADIARFFGTPLYLLNAGKQAYSSNEQNSLDFVKYTLMPLLIAREQEDSYKLLLPGEREKGLRIKREVKGLLRGDSAAQAAWYRTMRELGVYAPNEIRALEDLKDVPGGDTRYASLNYIPLELFAELSVLRAQNKQGGEKD